MLVSTTKDSRFVKNKEDAVQSIFTVTDSANVIYKYLWSLRLSLKLSALSTQTVKLVIGESLAYMYVTRVRD